MTRVLGGEEAVQVEGRGRAYRSRLHPLLRRLTSVARSRCSGVRAGDMTLRDPLEGRQNFRPLALAPPIARRGARGFLARAVFVATCLVSPVLQAERPHRVVVLDARDIDDPITLELLARVRGELGAAGFEVVVVPVRGRVDPRVAVETLARDMAPAAVLSVRHVLGAAPGQSIAEMWVSDRLSSRTLMQRATFDQHETGTQTARLAVQVAELLKARFTLVEPGSSGWTPVPVRAEQVSPLAAEPASAPPREVERSKSTSQVTLGAGLGVLHNFKGGLGSVWAPLVRVGFAPSLFSTSAFAVEVRVFAALSAEAATLGFGPGRARVRQGFVLGEALGRFLPNFLVAPLLSVGNGAVAVAAMGEAAPPYTANAETTWSGLTSLGAGIGVRPSPGVAWVIEGQIMASWSKTDIAVANRTIGSVGSPMGFLSTSVVGIY